jgi:hypothetical protein
VEEEPLLGGIANAGSVVRRGDAVVRPANPYSVSIHRFLRAIRQAGFEGASEPLALEGEHEMVRYIPGDVPHVPYPDWVQADEALVSIAALLRRFHEASRSFDPSGHPWASELRDPVGGDVVGHNDVCLENVVFQDGKAIALFDFDYAAPGRPLYDLAHFARMCVPLDDEASAEWLGWIAPDRLSRLRAVADAYELDARERREWLPMIDQSIDQSKRFVADKVEAGDPGFIMMWNWIGGAERFDRRRRWWLDHRAAFARALR